METPKERIQGLMNHLNLSTPALSSVLGYSSPQILYEILQERTQEISLKLAKKINYAFPEIPLSWLLTGEGEMVREPSQNAPRTSVIRYYPDVKGTAGDMQFLENPDERFIELHIPMFKDCQTAVNVHGRSMEPLFMHGEIVLLKEWTERFIEWGKVYLVITRDGYRCIKYLFPSNHEGHIICHSENTENHPDFELELSEVAHLYLVRGRLNYDFI